MWLPVTSSQKEQRRRGERTEEGVGIIQHDGAQSSAVLHFQAVAQQVQDLRRTGAHIQ